MRGIESKNEVGFLTINEYFRFVEVGEYYKSPSLPIWVIFLGKYYQILYGWTNNIINECISF